MCNPAAITLAITAISAVTTHEAQVDAVDKQTEGLNKAEALRQSDLERTLNQQNEQASDEMNAANRAAISDMATLDAIAGEYGGGKTADRGRAVLGVQQGETLATIKNNARAQIGETGFASIASNQNTLSQIRSLKAPSQVGTMLSIGAAAAGAYGNYQTNQRLDKAAIASPKSVQ